jgi:large subunit ribosomal protein L10
MSSTLRQNKEHFVERMKADLAKAESVLFVDFTGLTVLEANNLRIKLREAEVSYLVVKNTLMKRAVAGTSFEDANQWLKGSPTGVMLGFEDPAAAARATYEFMKDCPHIKVKGGVLENKAINESEAEELSKMPTREEMHGQILGLALGVSGNLLSQIKSPGGRIVGAVEMKAKEDEAA